MHNTDNYTEIITSEQDALSALAALGNARVDEPLSGHTSFKTGGPARVFFEPQSAEGLIAALRYLADSGIAPFVMGRGTNVLFADEGFPGVVVCIGSGVAKLRIDGEALTAQAGALLSGAAAAAASAGLSGFEALSGIPGTIGGAVFMNAGAYDHEIRDIAATVSAYDPVKRETVSIGAEDAGFVYRGSRFSRSGEIVLEATFRLTRRPEADIRADMRDYARRRREKQPVELPSAGSFFKRPPGAYAGALIEKAGLKGRRVGGAQVSEKHAGFIVNTGGATTADILELMRIVQNRVLEHSGILLEPEPRILPALPDTNRAIDS